MGCPKVPSPGRLYQSKISAQPEVNGEVDDVPLGKWATSTLKSRFGGSGMSCRLPMVFIAPSVMDLIVLRTVSRSLTGTVLLRLSSTTYDLISTSFISVAGATSWGALLIV